MNQPKKFLRVPAVVDLVGKSRTTIFRAVRAGTFPAPVHIGERAIAWDSDEIAKWQADVIAASRANA